MGSQDISCYVFNSCSYEPVKLVITFAYEVMTVLFVVLETGVAMAVG